MTMLLSSQAINTIYKMVNEIAELKGCTPTSFTKITRCSDDFIIHDIVKTAYKCNGRGLDKYNYKQYFQAVQWLNGILVDELEKRVA